MASTPKNQRASTPTAYDDYVRQVLAAEKVVVGACLIESTAIARVADILKPEHFSNEALGIVYRAVLNLWTDGVSPDMLNVCDRLQKEGSIEKVGGMYGISVLGMNVGSTTNLEYHARFVRQSHTQRALLESGQLIEQMAMDLTRDVADQVSKAIKTLEAVADDMDYNNTMVSVGEAAGEALKEYDAKVRARTEGRQIGVTSGLKVLDKYTNLFQPGQLIILGARPAMGKTAMMLHFAVSMARSGKSVVIFSLEMTRVALTNRIIQGMMPGVNPYSFRGGYLTNDECRQMVEARNELESLPLWIDDCSDQDVTSIKVACMKLQRTRGLDCIMIDYLQLMNVRADNRQYNREQEIAQTTRRLKNMTKELGVPIVVLSQLSRNVERGGSRMPQLSDLRESGAIEQDADVVLFIHRPEYYEEPDAIKGVGLINMAKQRDGRTGLVEFGYNESLTKIFDYDENFEKEDGTVPF